MSYVKSGIRMLGFMALMNHAFVIAGFVLVIAEALGIVEELPGMYKGTKTS
jgi:hypothetical protein